MKQKYSTEKIIRYFFYLFLLCTSLQSVAQEYTQVANLTIVRQNLPQGPFVVDGTYNARFMVKNEGRTAWSGLFIAKTADGEIERHFPVQNLKPNEQTVLKFDSWSPKSAGQKSIGFYYQTNTRGRGRLLGTTAGTVNTFSFTVSGKHTTTDIRPYGDILFYKDGQGIGTTDIYVGENYELHFMLKNHGSATFAGTVYTTKRGQTTHFLDPVPNDFTIAAGKIENIRTRAISPTNLGNHIVDVWVKPNGGVAKVVGSINFTVKQKTTTTPQPNQFKLACSLSPKIKNNQGGEERELKTGKTYTYTCTVANNGTVNFNDILYLRRTDGTVVASTSTIRINAGREIPISLTFNTNEEDISTSFYALYTKKNSVYELVEGSRLNVRISTNTPVAPAEEAVNILRLSPDINQLVPQNVYREQTLYYTFRVEDNNRRPKKGIVLRAKWEKTGREFSSRPSDEQGIVVLPATVTVANTTDRIVFVSALQPNGSVAILRTNEFEPQPAITVLTSHSYDPQEVEVIVGYEDEQLNNLKGGASWADNVKFRASCGWERNEAQGNIPVLPDYVKMSAAATFGFDSNWGLNKLIDGADVVSDRLFKCISNNKFSASADFKLGFKTSARSTVNTFAGFALMGIKEWVSEWLNPSNRWVSGAISMLDTGIDYTVERMTPIHGESEASVMFQAQAKHLSQIPKWRPFHQLLRGASIEGEIASSVTLSEKLVQTSSNSYLHESIQGKVWASGEMEIPALQINTASKKAWGYKGTLKYLLQGLSNVSEIGASNTVRNQDAFAPYSKSFSEMGIELSKLFKIKGAFKADAELIPEHTINYGGQVYQMLLAYDENKNATRLRPITLYTNVSDVTRFINDSFYQQTTLDELRTALNRTEKNTVEVSGGIELTEFALLDTDLKPFVKENVENLTELPITIKYSYPLHKNEYYHAQAKRFLTTDSYEPLNNLPEHSANMAEKYVRKTLESLKDYFREALNDVVLWYKEKGLQKVGEFANSVVEFTNHTRNYLGSLFRGKELRQRAMQLAQKNIEPQISRIKFTFEGNGKVFPVGTSYDFSYAYPAGEATGTVGSTGEEFIVVSDIFYLSATSPEGKAYIDAPNGTFSVTTSVGRDDLTTLALNPQSRVMLYYLPQGKSGNEWEVVGAVGEPLRCRGMGCYALGVNLEQDRIPPTIICQPSFEEKQLLIKIEDNVSVNWRSLSVAVNGQIRAYRRTDESNTIIVPLLDSDLLKPDEMTLLITVNDFAHNTARFEQIPPISGIGQNTTTSSPYCTMSSGEATLHADESWLGAAYSVIDFSGRIILQGKVEKNITILSPLRTDSNVLLLRLTQNSRTFTSKILTTKK